MIEIIWATLLYEFLRRLGLPQFSGQGVKRPVYIEGGEDVRREDVMREDVMREDVMCEGARLGDEW